MQYRDSHSSQNRQHFERFVNHQRLVTSQSPAWTIWWPVAIFAGIMGWALLGGLFIHFMGF